MTRLALAILATACAAAALAACGGGGDGDGAGQDFAAQANEACADATRGVVDANLRVGVPITAKASYQEIKAQIPARAEAVRQLHRLQAPEGQEDLYRRFVAERGEQVAANSAQVQAYQAGDDAAGDRADERAGKAVESGQALARRLGLEACALQLPPDDAKTVKALVREYAVDRAPKRVCSEDLVLREFLEVGYAGTKACFRFQHVHADEFADDVTFDKVQGLDNVAAIIDFKDVGGKYDGVPTTATLYYVGGSWKVFYVETQS
jgi:hypothetical protein